MTGSKSVDADVVIIGGGHNALVAAAYLARAGTRVILLERLPHLGGAAVSERPWTGVDAKLSRYSYLVSLLPEQLRRDLGLRLELKRRRISSYTPDPAHPERGILVDTGDPAATAQSFREATGDAGEASRFAAFYERLAPVARATFGSVMAPLPKEADIRTAVGDDELWEALTQRPLGELLRSSLHTDIARGIALTDGLIGTFARADDSSLCQNLCFLYHVIGGGTGDWDVPVGGMGQVSAALEDAARRAGADLRTNAAVASVSPDGEVHTVDGERFTARLILSGVAPAVLDTLLGDESPTAAAPEGAQLKVNMLLKRLPRLLDTRVDPTAAFAGTFHINETMSQLDRAYDAAANGAVPDPLPAEIYCHSLTDPTILGPELRASGAQTLTLFGLHVPHRLSAAADGDAFRESALQNALRSLNSVLAEPIEDTLFVDANGAPCIEARTTTDLEESLAMSAGDIFHGPLSWPWATDDDPLNSPAARWGVATSHDRILRCGAGAQRGGAVSGLGGHDGAMAALEILRS